MNGAVQHNKFPLHREHGNITPTMMRYFLRAEEIVMQAKSWGGELLLWSYLKNNEENMNCWPELFAKHKN